MTHAELEEYESGWRLNGAAPAVARICLDTRVVLLIVDGGDSFEVVIEQPLIVRSDRRESVSRLPPHGDLSWLPSLVGARVLSLVATNNGTLNIAFESNDNVTIVVEPDADFESWGIETPSVKIISMPGGELAVWERPR